MKPSPTHQDLNTFVHSLTTYTYTDFQIPSHFHKNLELILPLNGSAAVCVNQQEYTVTSDACLLILSYQLHSIQIPSDAKVWVATFSPHYVKAFLSALGNQKPNTPFFFLSPEVRSLLFRQLVEPYPKNLLINRQTELPKALEFKLKSCLYAVCGDYWEQVTFTPGNKDAETISIDILRYIATHFQDDISLQSAAAALGYNYQYLSRIFHQTIGLNFKSVLNQYRLEYAIQLLRENKKSVSEAAFESGFQSLRTFHRVCFEIYNIPPTKLR